MENRRKLQRYRVKVKGSIRVEGQNHRIESDNLSVGGAQIALDAPLLEGGEVRVSLELPDKNAPGGTVGAHADGVVIWCQEALLVGFQAGVRFHQVSTTSRRRLESFLAKCMPI